MKENGKMVVSQIVPWRDGDEGEFDIFQEMKRGSIVYRVYV